MNQLTALQRIALASDHSVLHAVEHLYDQLAGINDFDAATLLSDVPVESTTGGAIALLVEDSQQHYAMKLAETESVHFARHYLVALSTIDEFAQRLIIESLEQWNDERQTVGKVLSRGAVVTLLLIAMSTSFKYESDSLIIEKEALSAEQMKAFGEVAVSLINQLGIKQTK